MRDHERRARDRLQESARKAGSSLAELSGLLGRNPAYLQQYVRRGSPRHLDEPDLRRIAEYLGIAADTIATRPLGREGEGREQEAWIDVPRLPLEASAGPGAVAESETAHDAFRFSRRWLRESGLEGAELSAIRVEGDSMEPLLRSGDDILVDRRKRSGDGVFVVRIEDVLHVKQVQPRGQGRLALVSANPAYAPMELADSEVEVIGRVVWKGGRM
jgi:phage repressor protein C with HTH and peptisase S24 domain